MRRFTVVVLMLSMLCAAPLEVQGQHRHHAPRPVPHGCRPGAISFISKVFNVAVAAITINAVRNEIERARHEATLSGAIAVLEDACSVGRNNGGDADLITQEGQDYYYQDGVFYVLEDGRYVVVEAPVGAVVSNIPGNYEEVEIDGETYYQVGNTLYRPSVIKGKLYFEVACNL